MKSECWSVVLRSIVSFGAPVSNEYKLIVEGQAPISIHTSQVSFSKFYVIYRHYYVSLSLYNNYGILYL